MPNTKIKILKLTESAIMIALAVVLSMFTFIAMPMGGSVTPFSTLPIIIIAYRYGTKWGLVTGAAYGFLQLLLGLNNLQYGATFLAVLCIILFDYIVAFTVLGLAGIFKNKFSNIQSLQLSIGVIFTAIVRFICHFITGWQIWKIWAPEGTPAWAYSLSYNASYMVPETVITVSAAILISSVLDFKSTEIKPIKNINKVSSKTTLLLKAIGIVFCVFAIAFDPFFIKITGNYSLLILILIPLIFVSIGAIFILLSKMLENITKN